MFFRIYFIPVMAKLNFQHSNMLICCSRNIYYYIMLKTVLLLNIHAETMIYYYSNVWVCVCLIESNVFIQIKSDSKNI